MLRDTRIDASDLHAAPWPPSTLVLVDGDKLAPGDFAIPHRSQRRRYARSVTRLQATRWSRPQCLRSTSVSSLTYNLSTRHPLKSLTYYRHMLASHLSKRQNSCLTA